MILWTCLCMYPNVFLKNPNRSHLHWSDWLLVWYLVLFCVGLTEKFKCFFTEDIKHGIMSPICNILTACDFFTKAYYVSYAYWTHATYMYVRSWFRRLVCQRSEITQQPRTIPVALCSSSACTAFTTGRSWENLPANWG